MRWTDAMIIVGEYAALRIAAAVIRDAWSRRSPRPAQPRRARRIARAVIAWRTATTRWQRFTADARMFPLTLDEGWTWRHLVLPTYRSRTRLAPPVQPVPDWWKRT